MGGVITFILLVTISWVIFKKLFAGGGGGSGSIDAMAAQHGAKLDYQYKNLLGIDIQGERVFALGTVLRKDEIRSVENSSILETKVGGWGHQFHKDKHCKLIINTHSLEQPLVAVPFAKKSEMDEWYARLGVFCKLS
jgi:hypothetical protein